MNEGVKGNKFIAPCCLGYKHSLR